MDECSEVDRVPKVSASPNVWCRVSWPSPVERSGLATLKAYVEALGGTVEVIAIFGDRKIVLDPQG